LIVLGRVLDLDVGTGGDPLLFFRGGYGRFEQGFRTAPGRAELVRPLRCVDQVRHLLESAAETVGVQCFALAVVGDEMVNVGGTGDRTGSEPASPVGHRVPIVAPIGAAVVAWTDDAAQQAWIKHARLSDSDTAAARESLRRVRERGCSVALVSEELIALEVAVSEQSADVIDGDRIDAHAVELARRVPVATHEPAVIDADASYRLRSLSAPVLDETGRVLLVLSFYGFPDEMQGVEVEKGIRALRRPGGRNWAAGELFF
jgi:DNA-binding IclR family transcriptional regulator